MIEIAVRWMRTGDGDCHGSSLDSEDRPRRPRMELHGGAALLFVAPHRLVHGMPHGAPQLERTLSVETLSR